TTALARLHTNGVPVTWHHPGAKPADLPTYAFQHQHYWLEATPEDVTSAGLVRPDHPLLGAMTELPDSGGHLFTAQVSLRTQPWLADHTINGTVLLPGTGFVELALRAAQETGAGGIDELVIEAPLVVPERGAVQLQITVHTTDADRHTVAIHSRPADADPGTPWTRHATGTLAESGEPAGFDLGTWPPPGAESQDLDTFYDTLVDSGYQYGPVFQGLRAVWVHGEETFAEIDLPDDHHDTAARYGIHPALLDAALHATMLATAGDGRTRLPFAWTGITLHATGAARLRAHITPAGPEATTIRLADDTGAPVAVIGSLVARPVAEDQLGSARTAVPLHRLAWTELPAPQPALDVPLEAVRVNGPQDVIEAATTAPGLLLLALDGNAEGDRSVPGTVHALTTHLLSVLQALLTEPALADTRLLVTTRGAVAATPDDTVTDLAAAAAWGLIGSAQSENPGRVVVVDLDGPATEDLPAPLSSALATGEPRLALREGKLHAARLARVDVTATEAPASRPDGTPAESPEAADESPEAADQSPEAADESAEAVDESLEAIDTPIFRPDGTVLITGGTGTLGGILARHLVTEYGVRELLLTSRSGRDAAGSRELEAELVELGATVRIEACDAADRDALAALLDTVRLSAVVHTAGVLDDGVVTGLTDDQMHTVLTPKADAAWNLHELTAGHDLDAFVLYSSAAGAFGSPGQGNYAAANTFLDALAHHRRAQHLPGLSLAWGLWAPTSTMTSGVVDVNSQRMSRGGVVPLAADEGMALFDAALRGDDPAPVAVKLDHGALRAQAEQGTLPTLLHGLARPMRRAARGTRTANGDLATRLAAMSAAEAERTLLATVRREAAAVLGHASADSVDAARAFTEIGFDSLTAVELRNRLAAHTGLQLPATLLFDHPAPAALAAHLRTRLTGDGRTVAAATGAMAAKNTTAHLDEPIAIVGMACRLPGGVRSPEDLWALLAEGREGIGPFPADRGWDLDELYDPDPEHAGTSYVREGGFLHDAADFDPAFFGISPREALAMDPQQRLLLETAWESIEHAGIDPTSLRGRSVGVFAGVSYQDYLSRLAEPPKGLEGFLMTGGAGSVLSGRIAYALGLEGPAVALDTACSSSLVAIHLAGQALRAGECSMALAGGVAVMSSPDVFREFSRQQGLAADGRCKAFAATADGTGWAEGVGLVLLERLSDAHRNGHRVLAVVRGSAVNQDGASNGLTAPNGPAQQRVIRQALATAGLEPSDVDAVEAHGTGTTLGDPIEAQALLATYGQNRPDDRPVRLGSLKSNLGHTQAAAGVAGVIKMVQAMRHGVLPKTLHVEEPTPQVDWSEGAVELLTEAREWTPAADDRPRRAGVSAFGISGTNAHVILEEAPETEPETASEAVPPADLPVVPLVLSARGTAALSAQARQLATYISTRMESAGAALPDVAYALATGRAQLSERAVVLAGDRDEARTALAALAAGESHAGAVTGSAGDGRLAVLFTGQGSQRVGMGRELYDTFPAYASAFDEACAALDRHLAGHAPHSVADVVFNDPDGWLDRTLYTQTGLFAVETALYRLVESWGVRPDQVAGHSIGELTAAHIAGVLDLEDAAKLVAARARLMQSLPAGGSMITTTAPAETVAGLLTERTAVAAYNSPTNTVISGDADDIAAIRDTLIEQGYRARELKVSHAFHSPLMDPIPDEFAAVAETVTYRQPEIPLVTAAEGDPLTAGYWARHIRETVHFERAVRILADHGTTTYLEVGPTPHLTPAVNDTLDTATCVPTLSAKDSEARTLLTALATLHTRGIPLDWPALLSGGRHVDLPTYAFQHRRYWLDATRAASDAADFGLTDPEHPLLGAMTEVPGSDAVVFTAKVSVREHPWLGDPVAGSCGLAELALHAARETGWAGVAELAVESPLVVPERAAARLQVAVDKDGHVTVHSRSDDTDPGAPWTRHATGTLTTAVPESEADSAVATSYEQLDLPEEDHEDAERYGIHPSLLAAALHTLPSDANFPARWTGLRLRATGATRLRAVITPTADGNVSCRFADATGEPVACVDSVELAPVPTTAAQAESLYRLAWTPVQALTTRTHPTTTIATSQDIQALATAERVPDLVRLDLRGGSDEPDPAAVQALTTHTLDLLQTWLAEPALEDTHLLVVTHGAVATTSDEAVTDFAAAAVWGLVQSAQSENPGRITLFDTDTHTDTGAGVADWNLPAGEPHLAVRAGVPHAPRLVRAATGAQGPATLNPDGTVLITGGTGSLGRLLARHLVTGHGVRNLLLVSRSGPDAPGADDLRTELTALGANVRIEACDITDRDALAALLAGTGTDAPLTAVIHTAAVFNNGVIGSYSAERLEQVLIPKADAAWHLHELTKDRDDLDAFIVFSSATGPVLGAPGQGGYAAANAYLDALARHRHALGLPATSLAWGLWAQARDLFTHADLQRIERAGMLGLSDEQGLRLFDASLGTDEPVVIPTKLDFAALRSLGARGELPAVFDGLVRTIRRATNATPEGADDLATRLASLSDDDARRHLLDLVRAEIAVVLGHSSAADIDSGRAFNDLGFDSLTAVELRNRLVTRTGIRLPATLVFDHPNPAALARRLKDELTGGAGTTGAAHTGPRQIAATGADEPIAIVGMACRLPGGVSSPEELWDLVAAGRDAVTGFPTDRGWDLDTLFAPDPDRTGTSATREGGFLTDVGGFDAGFFGISPREALAMDPQQRLLLETSWEAFEHARIDPVGLRGSDIGVFAGVSHQGYGARPGDVPKELEGFMITGASSSVMSGRVAYTFGFEGPAVALDTACSSSLVAMHLAAQSLRAGECSMALAGGAAVMVGPGAFVEFSRQRGLSADGRCKAFAASADGTGWAEGIGVVLLERLSDARRNGHRVLAVIRGSAVNQDGASNGLTAPNGPAQQRVIRQALANADLSPSDVDAVEAHGTGTTLGDPIEAQALLATYGQDRPEDRPLWLGSLKSNIGHTQNTSGVAGVIKMVQAMRHGVLPRTLHVDEPTPQVDWSAGAVSLLTEARDWPEVDRPRRAAVSSFGMSGTNAHLILEEAPEPEAREEPTAEAPEVVALPLSAQSRGALQDQARQLLARLDDLGADGTRLVDIGYSLAVTRAAHPHRAVVVATGPEQATAALAALARGDEDPGVVTGTAGVDGKVVFVFPGQGSQWVGMGAELLDSSPVFADHIRACAEVLDPLTGWSLLDVVRGGDLGRVDVVQPATFAVMTGLAALWRDHGVVPDAVVGHSQGEIAAAYVAGALSLEDAARVVALRSQAIAERLAGRGGMVHVSVGQNQAAELLERWAGRLEVAAVNGTTSTVVAGDTDAVDELLEHCASEHVQARRIAVDYASHTHHVEGIRERLLAVLDGIEPQPARVPLFSTVDGTWLDTTVMTAEYWYRNLRQTVGFHTAI
ncbi:SDR family NAD(P)-dependent oxidoreductase, partial [Streptomyces ipomoeae]|uniref:SDR family NAD(P)-dependent oxidoreductase n=1 Tax=Streptomyces ipomoeae TaxID=103232 RepID=UPI0029B4B3F1